MAKTAVKNFFTAVFFCGVPYPAELLTQGRKTVYHDFG